MALNDVLRKAVVEDMETCTTINGISHPSMEHYFRQNLDTLKLLYSIGVLRDKDIDPILEKKIIDEAKLYIKMGRDHNDPTAGGFYVLRSSFLAYALKKGALSNRELKVIDFEGETIDSYVQRHYTDNLLKHVREELFNPKTLPDMKYDEHPVCDCMH